MMATTAHQRHTPSQPASADQQASHSPPSPALTNPDLLLPDDPLYPNENENENETTSQRNSYRNSSSLSFRQSDSHGSVIEVATATAMPMRLSVGPAAVLDTAVSPSYHSYEHGAPLSDIGEEESDAATERAPSPIPTAEPERPSSRAAPTLRHKKRISNLSNSSGGSDPPTVEDFDVSKLASSRVAADIENARDAADEDAQSRRNSKDLDEELALLNDRADEILESARKRLTHMEDNLSKARHSIIMPSTDRPLSSSKSSPNMHDSKSAQSPAGGLLRSISQTVQNRRSKAFPVKPQAPTHVRTGSDKATSSGSRPLSVTPEARSVSAIDFSRPRMLTTPEQTRVGLYSNSGRSPNSPLHMLSEEAETPSTVWTSPNSSSPIQFRGLGIHPNGIRAQEDLSIAPMDTLEPFNAVERSSSQASTNSARDLRDQMAEMKNRIAELKHRAHNDVLRRRSLQSLRTPSPFNDANGRSSSSSDRDQVTPSAQQERSQSAQATRTGSWAPQFRSPLSSTSRQQNHSGFEDVPVVHAASPVTPNLSRLRPGDDILLDPSSARTDRNTPNLTQQYVEAEELEETDGFGSIVAPFSDSEKAEQRSPVGDDDDEDEDDIEVNEEEQIYLNEVLEESLHEPEVPSIPDQYFTSDLSDDLELSHEERLDAFDYENMFLHSAMGTYRADENSDDENDDNRSDDSVETNRQETTTPTLEDDESDHDRSHSMHVRGEEDDIQTDREMEAEMLNTSSKPPSLPQAQSHSMKTDPQKHYLEVPRQPSIKIDRNNSADTVATTASYRTAMEGEHDEDYAGEDFMQVEDAPSAILDWGNTPDYAMDGKQTRTGVTTRGRSHSPENRHVKNQSSVNTIDTIGSGESNSSLGAPGSTVSGGSREMVGTNRHPRAVSAASHSGSFARSASAFGFGSETSTDGASENLETPQPAVQINSSTSHLPRLSNAYRSLHSESQQQQKQQQQSQSGQAQPRNLSHRETALQSSPTMAQSPRLGFSTSNSSNKSQIRTPGHSRNTSLQSDASSESTGPPATATKIPTTTAARARSFPVVPPQIPPPPPPSQRPPPIPSQKSLHPANTEILMESLIKLADPHFSLHQADGSRPMFAEIDKELVLNLLRAVGGVCNVVLRAQRERDGTTVKELRGALDDATGVLVDGLRPREVVGIIGLATSTAMPVSMSLLPMNGDRIGEGGLTPVAEEEELETPTATTISRYPYS